MTVFIIFNSWNYSTSNLQAKTPDESLYDKNILIFLIAWNVNENVLPFYCSGKPEQYPIISNT